MLSDRAGPDETTNPGGIVHPADGIAARLAAQPSVSLQAAGEVEAGVLVLLFPDGDGGLATLLTRRTESVRDHKGQICFPGGVRDAGDADLVAAALRETAEEIGVGVGSLCLVGRLDDYRTMTGYLVRPFVAYAGAAPPVSPSPVEIAEVIVLPLRRLLAPGVHELRRIEVEGAVFETHVFAMGEHVVWGATAAMLRDLLARLRLLP